MTQARDRSGLLGRQEEAEPGPRGERIRPEEPATRWSTLESSSYALLWGSNVHLTLNPQKLPAKKRGARAEARIVVPPALGLGVLHLFGWTVDGSRLGLTPTALHSRAQGRHCRAPKTRVSHDAQAVTGMARANTVRGLTVRTKSWTGPADRLTTASGADDRTRSDRTSRG
jgi:hypothetical protein